MELDDFLRRSDAKELLDLEEFQMEMEGIYSTSIGLSTLDESPMAYKPMGGILEDIRPHSLRSENYSPRL